MTPLPFAVREAIVDVCMKAFWYKNRLRSLFIAAGVPAELWDRDRDSPKPVIVRKIFEHLDKRGEAGLAVQYRILKELCALRAPDPDVADRNQAVEAIRELQGLGKQLLLETNASRKEREGKAAATQNAAKVRAERVQRLEQLHGRYLTLMSSSHDVQKRGYELEILLEELFLLDGVTYRPSFRNPTEQIDGSFEHKGWHYLVEAKWIKDYPEQGDLSDLKIKVDRKLSGTRGVYVSVNGFRDQVVDEFTRGISANLILIDGEDLMLILEDRMSLLDALDIKIARAAQHGTIYYRLSQYLRAAS